MRRVSLILTLLAALAQAAPSVQATLPWAEADEVGVSAERLAAISPTMQRFVDAGQLPGVVTMVARRGRLVHWEAVGFRDLESRDPLEPDDIFRIYSMTKPVTSVAVMMLVEDGALGLDDPVAEHLPAFARVSVYGDGGPGAPRRPITVRDLLMHTSGLAYGPPIGATPVDEFYATANVFSGDLANLVAEVTALPLVDHPGAVWNYSVSTDVLGRLVEVVGGMPFDEFLAARIFVPLGMEDTGFHVPESERARFATLYAGRPDGALQVIDSALGIRYDARPALPSGGGGLVSTASDYLRFAQMLLDGGELEGVRILEPETVAMMRTNQLPAELVPIGFGPQRIAGYGFGLGFSVLVDEEVTPEPDNDGVFRWLGIASTYFWIDPEAELVALALTQRYPTGQVPIEQAFQTLVYGALER